MGFKTLDSDGDRHLNAAEMQPYARLCGFSSDAWILEWAELCRERQIHHRTGISDEAFQRLIDEEHGNYYLNAVELLSCLEALKKGDPNILLDSKRTGLPERDHKEVLFRYFNKDRLGVQELRTTARWLGWNGTDAEWSVHFGEICNDVKIDPQNGVDLALFKRVLDKKGGPYDVSREAILGIISSWSQEPKRARKKTWEDVSLNYMICRDFCNFLRQNFQTAEHAFSSFSGNRLYGHLSEQDFLSKAHELGFDQQAEKAWKLMALSSLHLRLKEFKWAWRLLEAEEYATEVYATEVSKITEHERVPGGLSSASSSADVLQLESLPPGACQESLPGGTLAEKGPAQRGDLEGVRSLVLVAIMFPAVARAAI